MKGLNYLQKIQYTKQVDYYLPNLLPPQDESSHPFGKYSLMRREYLMNHRKVLYTNLLTSGKLNNHLHDVEEQAQNRMELLVRQMAEAQNITEELKSTNQIEWVGRMNNIHHSAEEIVLTELIYQ